MQYSHKLYIYIFLFSFVTITHAQNIINDSFGKGLKVLAKDSSFYTKMSIRFQTLYTGSTHVNTKDWEEQMMIRRWRLKFDGWAYSPKVAYKVELGVSNRDTRGGQIPESGNTASIILDAVIKWEFVDNWVLWVGQTKLPGNRERVISSQKLQFVDRSLVNSRFTLDRDIGVQLRHKYNLGGAVIKQTFAISTGEGRGIIQDNPRHGREYTVRFDFLPLGEFTSGGDYFSSDLAREQTPKLSVGITGDYNNRATRYRGNLGSFATDSTGAYVNTNLYTLFIDAMFKYKGISATSEYAYRTSSNKQEGFGYGNGIALAAGYLFKNNWEVASRYTTIEPISDISSIPEVNEYTISVSKYVNGHNLKVQSDFSYVEMLAAKDSYRIRMQCELSF